jgi:hypothetical protein
MRAPASTAFLCGLAGREREREFRRSQVHPYSNAIVNLATTYTTQVLTNGLFACACARARIATWGAGWDNVSFGTLQCDPYGPSLLKQLTGVPSPHQGWEVLPAQAHAHAQCTCVHMSMSMYASVTSSEDCNRVSLTPPQQYHAH